MKRTLKMLSALLLALALVFSLAACGGNGDPQGTKNPGGSQDANSGSDQNNGSDTPQTIDWSHFEDWTAEKWDSKTISYQFTGEWALEEYSIFNYFLINLYGDGSALIEQYSPGGRTYDYFGYWSEENTADGNEISLDTLYVTPDGGAGALVVHEYHYDLYEESDGGYSFGYTFGISAGAYFRDVDMTGSSSVTYSDLSAFRSAMDSVASSRSDTPEDNTPADNAPQEGDAPEGDENAVASYDTEAGLKLVLFADGTMRVEFPQYSMSRDGFTYKLDGSTLTVTGTPSDEELGAFAQIWTAAGAEVWNIDGTTATPA